MTPQHHLPADIERTSISIITRELDELGLTPPPETAAVVKRVIHTSADFDYADNLVFSKNAVERALDAIRNGASIVTDTQMGRSGINKKRLARYGGQVYCFMSDEDVAEAARLGGTTRASASMDKAAELYKEEKLIFAVGNAPTALVRLYELVTEGVLRPELIIGLKETPYIVARGRKGGSNIAACICNALLYMLDD